MKSAFADFEVCVSRSGRTAPIRLPKRLIGLAAGVFAVTWPIAGQVRAETPFTSPEGDFVVVFPGTGEPTHTMQSGESGPGAYTADYYVVVDAGSSYIAFSGTVDTSIYDSVDEALDDFSRGLYLGLGGEETAAHPFRFRGTDAIETVGTVDAPTMTGSIIGRGYLSGERIWGVLVVKPTAGISVDDPDVAAFFGSFDFVKAAF